MEERLKKAIKFFREFKAQSDRFLYRKAVLRFCDLVEEYLGSAGKAKEKDVVEIAEELFGEKSEK